MNRKRSQMQAYFAGIFDGEGHVGTRLVGTESKTWVVQVIIEMTDPQAVMLLWREYPEAYVVAGRTRIGKLTYRVQFTQHQAYRFLQDTLPFSLVKHEQIKIAMSLLAHKRRDHNRNWTRGKPRGTRKPECLTCARYAQRLLAIRAEVKGVNSVNALLDHELREYRAKPEEVSVDVAMMATKVRELLEGVETRDRTSPSVEPMSAPEKEIVQTVS